MSIGKNKKLKTPSITKYVRALRNNAGVSSITITTHRYASFFNHEYSKSIAVNKA